jgi:hypothetical protein
MNKKRSIPVIGLRAEPGGRLLIPTLIALAFALCLGGPARAAEQAALDVLEAYQLALTHDRRFQAVKAQLRSEREALPQAESRMRPSVSLTANRSRIDQSRDDGLGTVLRQRYNSEQDVMSLRQPVYSPKLLENSGSFNLWIWCSALNKAQFWCWCHASLLSCFCCSSYSACHFLRSSWHSPQWHWNVHSSGSVIPPSILIGARP